MFKTISPIDKSICYEDNYISVDNLDILIDKCTIAQKKWENIDLDRKIEICNAFLKEILEREKEISLRLSVEMGRPLIYGMGEIKGTKERADYIIKIAKENLKDKITSNDENYKTYIKHKPLGVIVIIPAWNYPYLTAINSVIPALLAGNSIIFKCSNQTPSTGKFFESCLNKAGLPEHIFENIHIDYNLTNKLVSDVRVNCVSFTGSVSGGRFISKNSNDYTLTGLNNISSIGYKKITLELGGKDAAYVRDDADINYTVEQIASGCFFNSGQCCCAVERVYVHKDIYDKFIENILSEINNYKLGDPIKGQGVNMGPLTKVDAYIDIKKKIKEALDQGAKVIDNNPLYNKDLGENYIYPKILVNVNQQSRLIQEETFAPIMPIIMVDSDEQAINYINDSKFGLTCSIWTKNMLEGEKLADKINTGTVYLNKCDYLDPSLAWTGIKESGMGSSLSYLSFSQVTRPKSYCLYTS